MSKVNEHNTSASSHSDIRSLITNLTTKLNTLADSDDTTLDQLSEIVVYIKNNKSLIDGITTSKLNISDVADNLTTNITNKALSAKQGVELKKLIDAITVPTKVSQLTNDSKFLTSVPAEYITEDELNTKGYLTKHQDISGKVDKVEGKGLSTVDFTTAYETKLKGLSNYNDTIIKNNNINNEETTKDKEIATLKDFIVYKKNFYIIEDKYENILVCRNLNTNIKKYINCYEDYTIMNKNPQRKRS